MPFSVSIVAGKDNGRNAPRSQAAIFGRDFQPLPAFQASREGRSSPDGSVITFHKSDGKTVNLSRTANPKNCNFAKPAMHRRRSEPDGSLSHRKNHIHSPLSNFIPIYDAASSSSA